MRSNALSSPALQASISRTPGSSSKALFIPRGGPLGGLEPGETRPVPRPGPGILSPARARDRRREPPDPRRGPDDPHRPADDPRAVDRPPLAAVAAVGRIVAQEEVLVRPEVDRPADAVRAARGVIEVAQHAQRAEGERAAFAAEPHARAEGSTFPQSVALGEPVLRVLGA